ncbi:MAG: leucine-rich repeat domain-containing protein [Stackebrandtia sp.]
MPRLIELSLHDCTLSDLRQLSGLSALENLWLTGTNAPLDIAALAELPSLDGLFVRELSSEPLDIDLAPFGDRELYFSVEKHHNVRNAGPNVTVRRYR